MAAERRRREGARKVSHPSCNLLPKMNLATSLEIPLHLVFHEGVLFLSRRREDFGAIWTNATKLPYQDILTNATKLPGQATSTNIA